MSSAKPSNKPTKKPSTKPAKKGTAAQSQTAVKNSSPTVFSIAKACGVSGTTVSLALRDDPRLRSETCARIQAYARKVGYRPNQAARNFKQSMTRTIGLILPSPTWWVDALMLDELYQQAAAVGYDLQIQFTHDDPAAEARAVGDCLDGKVDGLFVVSCLDVTDKLPEGYPLEAIKRRRTPLVFLSPAQHGMPCVHRDRVAAVDVAVQHLASQGYEQLYLLIAVRGPQTLSYKSRADQFLKSVKAVKFTADKTNIHYRNSGFKQLQSEKTAAPKLFFDYTLHHRYGYELAHDIFTQTTFDKSAGKRIGLVCASDSLASGAMRFCREQNLDIPGQVGIVGCDDTIANDLNLTTLKWNHTAMCQWVMTQLQVQIAGLQPTSLLNKVQPQLVARESTGLQQTQSSMIQI